MNKPKIKKLPEISEAQGWDSPDRFIYKGKLYEVDIHMKVKEVKDGH
jgi:hypothetical protein